MTAKDPTREELIALCEQAVVHTESWMNRDSSEAQLNIGKAWALLRSGCDYTIEPERKHNSYWLDFEFTGFAYFDYSGELDTEYCYIPTAERLAQNVGKDWY